MHTDVHQIFASSATSKVAKDIIAKCVHCGFCTATCPTYQELRDERDGPRGRIYLIKQFLETGTISEKSRTHLDRCLNCRSCETTCPSGVDYGRLVDVAKLMSEEVLPRSKAQQLLRWTLGRVLPNPQLFSIILFAGRVLRPILPNILKKKIPAKPKTSLWPRTSHARVMLALAGCVQSVTAPNTNKALARVLDKLSISLVEAPAAGCCGAVNHHLSQQQQSLAMMRKNIDAWWPAVESGIEAIVMTASGCGAMVQEYAELLADDPNYAHKAKKISALCVDVSQVLLAEDLSALVTAKAQATAQTQTKAAQKVAFHCPCTLQHALGQAGVVEKILGKLGVDLASTLQSHLCCGSAGTYSILQPTLSHQLRTKKLAHLSVDNPQRIVTANIGCQMHLESESAVPVNHWIELVDELV